MSELPAPGQHVRLRLERLQDELSSQVASLDDDTLVVVAPADGPAHPPRRGEEVTVCWGSRRGWCEVECQMETPVTAPRAGWQLRIAGQRVLLQRRAYARGAVPLLMRATLPERGALPAVAVSTVDICEGSFRLDWPARSAPRVGEEVRLDLTLEGEAVQLVGWVLYLEAPHRHQLAVVVLFDAPPADVAALIQREVLKGQARGAGRLRA